MWSLVFNRSSTSLTSLFASAVFLAGCASNAAPNEGDDDSADGMGTGGIGTDAVGSGGVGGGGLSASGTGGLSSTGGAAADSGGAPAESGGTGGGGADNGTGGTDNQASGGHDGTGGTQSSGSSGCGMNAGQPTGSWQGTSVNTESGTRSYDVWLPTNYEANRLYPVVLLLHGCSSGTNNVPMEKHTGDDAIVVRGTGSAASTCWNADAGGADLKFIDAMVEDVQERFCVNPDHLFAVGYSSGSWLASRLSCNRGDVFRAIATVTGGEPNGISGCSGQVARMFVHDQNDNDNKLA